jgi:hypothetical protein
LNKRHRSPREGVPLGRAGFERMGLGAHDIAVARDEFGPRDTESLNPWIRL